MRRGRRASGLASGSASSARGSAAWTSPPGPGRRTWRGQRRASARPTSATAPSPGRSPSQGPRSRGPRPRGGGAGRRDAAREERAREARERAEDRIRTLTVALCEAEARLHEEGEEERAAELADRRARPGDTRGRGEAGGRGRRARGGKEDGRGEDPAAGGEAQGAEVEARGRARRRRRPRAQDRPARRRHTLGQEERGRGRRRRQSRQEDGDARDGGAGG